jgi:adenylylsulfate kinase
MTTTHGWAIWLTGLPAAGKTTLAHGLRNRLCELDIATALLDTDELRPILAPGAPIARPSGTSSTCGWCGWPGCSPATA